MYKLKLILFLGVLFVGLGGVFAVQFPEEDFYSMNNNSSVPVNSQVNSLRASCNCAIYDNITAGECSSAGGIWYDAEDDLPAVCEIMNSSYQQCNDLGGTGCEDAGGTTTLSLTGSIFFMLLLIFGYSIYTFKRNKAII